MNLFRSCWEISKEPSISKFILFSYAIDDHVLAPADATTTDDAHSASARVDARSMSTEIANYDAVVAVTPRSGARRPRWTRRMPLPMPPNQVVRHAQLVLAAPKLRIRSAASERRSLRPRTYLFDIDIDTLECPIYAVCNHLTGRSIVGESCPCSGRESIVNFWSGARYRAGSTKGEEKRFHELS